MLTKAVAVCRPASAVCIPSVASSTVAARAVRQLHSVSRSTMVSTVRCTVATAARSPMALAGGHQVRHFGILDRLKSGVKAGFTEKAEEKKREMFQAQLDFLANSATYNMSDHLTLLRQLADKAGVNSWTSALRSKEQQAEVDEQFLDLKIGEALTDSEKADISTVHRREKLRVSAAVGCEVQRINKFFEGFEQSRTVHTWLQNRKAKGLPLPSGMQEYFTAMVADKVGMNDKKAAMSAQLGNVRSTRAMLRKM